MARSRVCKKILKKENKNIQSHTKQRNCLNFKES